MCVFINPHRRALPPSVFRGNGREGRQGGERVKHGCEKDTSTVTSRLRPDLGCGPDLPSRHVPWTGKRTCGPSVHGRRSNH